MVFTFKWGERDLNLDVSVGNTRQCHWVTRPLARKMLTMEFSSFLRWKEATHKFGWCSIQHRKEQVGKRMPPSLKQVPTCALWSATWWTNIQCDVRSLFFLLQFLLLGRDNWYLKLMESQGAQWTIDVTTMILKNSSSIISDARLFRIQYHINNHLFCFIYKDFNK